MSLSYSAARIRTTALLVFMLIVQFVSAGTAPPFTFNNYRDSINACSYGRWQACVTGGSGDNNTFFFIDISPTYTYRDPSIRLYEAMQSITFDVGFETALGDEFTAQIIVAGSQVPAPSNSTGSSNSDMNWIQAKHYDENGNVISESKQFFDNTGGLLQTQTKVKYRKDPTTTYTHVIASQSVRDALGRDAIRTLPAPIDNSEFIYKSDFVRNTAGGTYNYNNFDLTKTNSPDPVGAQPGTLGWYYSSNNTWEPYTPTTGYPYSRQSYYDDGTNNVNKTAGAGEVFNMGSGHEQSSYVSPVMDELTNYMAVRNRFFFSYRMGEQPASMARQAIQMISRDANGKEGIVIQDKSGKTLMTALSGSDMMVTNSVLLKAAEPYPYKLYASQYPGVGVTITTIKGATPINVYNIAYGGASTLVYSGAPGGWAMPAGYGGSISIESTGPFSIIYKVGDREGNLSSPLDVSAQFTTPNDLHYFKIFNDNSAVSITGNYTLYDLNTGSATMLVNGNQLNKGYYKLQANSGTVALSYTNGYSDISYSFYNHLGQLVTSIAPQGVKKLLGTGYSNYSTIDDVPFISQYEYDVQGRMVKSTSTDGGTSEMVYRSDGKIRFSQNAEQKTNGRYSYTNYDQLGRPVESGEYDGSGIAFNADMSAATNPMRDILDNISATGGLTSGTKTDVMMTVYDVADNTHLQTNYVQNAGLLGGAVSVTKKYSSIVNNTPSSSNLVSATWYNYDPEGKVIWKVWYTQGLGYKTEDYTYDVPGRLVKKVYQKYPMPNNETFVHYYDYDDVTQKLWKVSTAKTEAPADKVLQATYIYYLHGPLKRVELAGNLQGIDYTYTLQGALKAINNSDKTKDPGVDEAVTGFNADVFGMVLDYYPGDYQNSRTSGMQPIKGVNTSAIGQVSYAGNIKSMTWFSKKPAAVSGTPGIEDPLTYVYQYDDKYQFTESTWGTDIDATGPGSFKGTTLNKETVKNPTTGIPAYDANGNILNLQRTGAAGTYDDRFTYNYLNKTTNTGSNTDYNTNKLQSVTNDANGTSYATYTYDKLGQLTSEDKGGGVIRNMKYDVAGKAIKVMNSAGQPIVEYVYNEVGQRIMKKSYSPSNVLLQITYYVGDVIYTQAVTGGTSYGPIVAQEYEVQGGSGRLGVYYRQSDIYTYELNDHLGNVRALIAKNNGTMEVRMYTDYYPYGMPVPGQYQPPAGYRYGYQGQYAEKDDETGWNAFELRMYDSKIGRWLQHDPKGEFWSPYVGMGNDPVRATDPDGGSTDIIRVTDTKGNRLFDLDDGKAEITTLTAKQLYDRGIQWFEPLADNYMKPIWMNPEIGKLDGILHFSWDDIVKFAEVDRWMLSYRQGGSGDWKASEEGANKFFLVTVGGSPYWADAVGQIPFAVDYFTDVKITDGKINNSAIAQTISAGREYGDGKPVGGTRDNSNRYDNYFVLRGAYWANQRYQPVQNGNKMSLQKTDFSSNSLGNSINQWQSQRWLR